MVRCIVFISILISMLGSYLYASGNANFIERATGTTHDNKDRRHSMSNGNTMIMDEEGSSGSMSKKKRTSPIAIPKRNKERR